ncbi:type II toxin-antitoxin system VapC family toxin [Candidatus Woesearchaeota archaeon]|nr:type II toxin-antitoxin system VapC family toxin [Candidatus Woesearchaeota archaeon]
MTLVCLDTTWTVDFFRNRKEAVQKLKRLQEENAILTSTAATVFETLYGFFIKNEQEKARLAVQFFRSMQSIFPLDMEAGCQAAEIAAELAKKGLSIGHFDSLIAGSMLRNGCQSIVTSNLKDFGKIKGINCVP